jgi:hypothetical protein
LVTAFKSNLCLHQYSPKSWINCSAHIPAAELPPGTLLNTNGAGDSFVSGLLVAAMIRHTGMDAPPPSPSRKGESVKEVRGEPESFPKPTSSSKKMTPYNLYMKQNYMSLKQQYHGDKKAIFERCHEMWENESADVKFMYERMAREENEDPLPNENALDMMSDVGALESHMSEAYNDSLGQNYTTDESLNLESAVTFAGLVAAYHVDMSTRDLDHLDVSKLLEKAAVFPSQGNNLAEI